MIFRIKVSSGIYFKVLEDWITTFLKFSSKTTSGTFSTSVNKSFNKLMKMDLSSVTIFGRLKSLSAPNNNKFSFFFSLARFNFPAYLKTLLTALNPQS